jgi:putative inorganic carbon (HCO3(-)) transporter
MSKKNPNRKTKIQPTSSPLSTEKVAVPAKDPLSNQVIRRKPLEIPAFWVAVIIPIICLVGAWTFPTVATPMELKSYASQIYLSGMLLIWFWMHRDKPKFSMTFSPVRVAFLLLFIAGTLSLLWAVNPHFWVYKWNKWFAGSIMFLLGLRITQNEKNFDTIINLTIFGALIVAAIGIGQYLFGLNLIPQTAFPSSTFGNANMAGQVMVLTIGLPLYFLFKKELSTKQVWFYALAMSVLLTYLFFTRTRAVWIACALETVLILAFVVLDKKRREWCYWNQNKTQAGVAALVFFLIVINFNQNGFEPFWEIAIYEISSISTSVASTAQQVGGERYLIWGGAWEMIKDHPLIGTGLGSFFHNVNTPEYQIFGAMGVQRVHNEILELLVELGALGLLLLIGIIVSMCILLYKMILHSKGHRRILFALLTIAVTGSMLNAQLSFPYELPVPLVIMPFFVSLIVRGSEDIMQNTRELTIKPLFNKVALAISAILFLFITVNDSLWFRDVHMLNRLTSGRDNKPWQPVNPIYNQAYITGSRSVSEALKPTSMNVMRLNVVKHLFEYWPYSTANNIIAAETYLSLSNIEEAEFWANRTVETQPAGTFMGEFILMEIMQKKGDIEGLRTLYESLKSEPESSLSKNSNTYNMLHSMAINLEDYGMVTHFYDKFIEYHGEFSPMVANQAVYYFNIGDYANAITYMSRTIELAPNHPYAEQFRGLIEEYSASIVQ